MNSTPAAGLLRSATATLEDAGVGSPRVDAEILLAHVLGVSPAELRREVLLGRAVEEVERTAYDRLVELRSQRVPLQHLTGEAHFRGLTLAVGPGVFVPRPETEVLVELALRDLREPARPHPVVVDLGTGSGAIALAVAGECPAARVHAVEISPEAHAWAARNVAATGLAVDLRLGTAQDAFEELVGTVDVVVSNPPYIPPGAVPVDPEVRDHDPEVALYGLGDDGLKVPREVAERAAVLLAPGGVLLMEHADVQRDSLTTALLASGHWCSVEDHRDLAGLPRVTRAVRAGERRTPSGARRDPLRRCRSAGR